MLTDQPGRGLDEIATRVELQLTQFLRDEHHHWHDGEPCPTEVNGLQLGTGAEQGLQSVVAQQRAAGDVDVGQQVALSGEDADAGVAEVGAVAEVDGDEARTLGGEQADGEVSDVSGAQSDVAKQTTVTAQTDETAVRQVDAAVKVDALKRREIALGDVLHADVAQ